MATAAPAHVVSGPTNARPVPRYSVVRAVRLRPGGSCLVLESPAHTLAELDLDRAPDDEAAEALRAAGLRPLAVRIELEGANAPRCSALFATGEGPRRCPTSLGAALALCAQGGHTVVTRAD